jgi:N-acetyl sugar amidotransferase
MKIGITLDKQFDSLPTDIQFCTNCVVSNQRPRVVFDQDGVCAACKWAYEKDYVIDWRSRAEELEELCNRHRSKDGSYDVIVPGSGGKDSAYVAHQLRTRYKMNPLCVTWAPFDWTDVGWSNLKAFAQSGFTNITAQPGGVLHRKMSRLAFVLKGDAFEPFCYGQKSWAFHMADKFNIKLIFYGENGDLEYSGVSKYKNKAYEGPEEWAEEYFKGSGVDDLLKLGAEEGAFTAEDLRDPAVVLYKAPDPETIISKTIEMHWFSYYQRWTPQENFYYCAANTGFQTNPEGRSEGTYTKHASLDDVTDGFHFYLSYMKFGLGRASRDAQTDIRRHHLTRDEGLRLVRRFDGEFPKRHFKWFLSYLDITEKQFWDVMDFYRSKSNAWKLENGSWIMKYPAV